MYMIQIQLSPTNQYQSYSGWDDEYETTAEAEAAKKRALDAGYHGVRIVKLSDGHESGQRMVYCHGCGEEIAAAAAHWHNGEPYCDGCELAPSED